MSDTMIQLTALWKQTSQQGRPYLAGNFGGARLMIFPNEKKTPGSKEPDYRVFIAASKGPNHKGAKENESE